MVHQQSAFLVEFLSSASNGLHSPIIIKFIVNFKLELVTKGCNCTAH
jgi:hypothetical protein